ncbi:MAG: UDP-glucose 4-epimerase GalE [Alphaproteobacteria bacterium]|nr:UDP-glucose 4-epimerase GalE [Alphaproteobacteria bacterium]
MRVLVTGGAGYVGAHACKALAAAGHTPIVFDNLTQGHAEAVRWGKLEIGDLSDAARLDHVFRAHAPEAVMHFAALSVVADSVADPALYYAANIGGTLALLAAMRRAGVDTIVFSSTAAVYGTPEISPIVESAPLAPINPYGFSKLVIERAFADYQRAYGLKWCALRYFNAAGADPDGEIGEAHDPETHVLPLAIRAALGHGGAFRLFGEDYPTPDGTCVRDYVHVADLADAHVAALDYLAGGGAPAAFNLGSGEGASVRQILAAIGRAVGRDVPLQTAPRRPGDPPALVADPARAMAALGWRPRLSGLDDIVRTAVAWHRREGTG